MQAFHHWLYAALAILVTGCGENADVSNGGWKYEGEHLSSHTAPVPLDLAQNGMSPVTPLGTFVPTKSNGWTRIGNSIPLPDPTEDWVQNLITSTTFTEEMNEKGYYKVNDLDVDPGTW